MATSIAVIALLIIVISVPLIFLKPAAVFYLYLVSMLFSSIIAGYIIDAGKLGMPRAWSPADFLSVWTFFAALFMPRDKMFNSSVIEKILIVMGYISVFSLLQGFILNSGTVLRYSRVAFFVPALIFSIKYFTTGERVKSFFKFAVFILFFMFTLHVLIRLGLFTPPTSETDKAIVYGGLAGETGTRSLVPLLYLVLIGIGVGRLSSKTGFTLFSAVIILVGIGGIILTESRSTYGATVVLAICSFIFMKNKIKAVVFFAAAGFVAVFVAGMMEFDFLARFRADYGPSGFTLGLEESLIGWRGKEYGLVANSYKSTPWLIITGRGVGAMHLVPGGDFAEAGYYHSEYIGWLDRCGLIGLVAIFSAFFACLWRSYLLSRSDSKMIFYLGSTCFLVLISLMAQGVFHPILSHMRAATFIIPLFAIIGNWQSITYQDSCQQFEEQQQYYGYQSADEIVYESEYSL
jgi:hypothetical protein